MDDAGCGKEIYGWKWLEGERELKVKSVTIAKRAIFCGGMALAMQLDRVDALRRMLGLLPHTDGAIVERSGALPDG